MLTKVTHITLFVHSQDEALKFYTEKLGFVVHTDADFQGFRWLTICLPQQPDMEIALMAAMTPAEKAIVGKQGGDKPFISLESTDCLGDYERLSAMGVTFFEKPKTETWGISIALQDLLGNVIYMCQPTR
jgi:catechol 2,3-dioxygenase-like lactoylglutathione lyase family enzyme